MYDCITAYFTMIGIFYKLHSKQIKVFVLKLIKRPAICKKKKFLIISHEFYLFLVQSFTEAIALNMPCVFHEQCFDVPHALCLNGNCGCIEGHSAHNSSKCLQGMSFNSIHGIQI